MSLPNEPLGTKQQRRAQEQTERLKYEKRTVRSAHLKRIGLWIGVAAGLGFMLWGLAKLGSNPSEGGGAETTATLTEPATDHDWTQGNKLAAVTLIEYSDLQCPACRAAQPAVKALLARYGEKIRFIYRHFPLSSIHKNAEVAARAAEAAGKQGKFWEMHDKLFAAQPEWAEQSAPRDSFRRYAAEFNLDAERFQADLDAADVQSKVRADADSAVRSGVGATPTFFLNGVKLRLTQFSDLETAVAEAVKK